MEPLPRSGVGGLNGTDPGATGAVGLEFDAVVLAGGRATRLGGYPKPQLDYAGLSLLERALGAVRAARMAVVVGPGPGELGGPPRTAAMPAGRPSPRRVVYALEEPRFGGPLAALGTGLAALSSAGAGPDGGPWTALLAADLPRVGEAVALLLGAAAADPAVDGIVGQDESGRNQPLLALYRRGPLERAVAEIEREKGLADRPLRELVARLDLLPLPLPPGLSDDVDTWEAAERWGIGRPESPGAAARREDPR
ncbi:NTP transferase domain-containing protein [Sinomonas mesophila]|uniref:NTP transferase domain-containing protein n=1 Tax=Sinomonas mesophila TaxID=1531955 RepID=UPI001FE3E806|nr:NTP transferase domain-containing protein [Sinomonas mesophila]